MLLTLFFYFQILDERIIGLKKRLEERKLVLLNSVVKGINDGSIKVDESGRDLMDRKLPVGVFTSAWLYLQENPEFKGKTEEIMREIKLI